jgi:hypothetical protein
VHGAHYGIDDVERDVGVGRVENKKKENAVVVSVDDDYVNNNNNNKRATFQASAAMYVRSGI